MAEHRQLCTTLCLVCLAFKGLGATGFGVHVLTDGSELAQKQKVGQQRASLGKHSNTPKLHGTGGGAQVFFLRHAPAVPTHRNASMIGALRHQPLQRYSPEIGLELGCPAKDSCTVGVLWQVCARTLLLRLKGAPARAQEGLRYGLPQQLLQLPLRQPRRTSSPTPHQGRPLEPPKVQSGGGHACCWRGLPLGKARVGSVEV